LSGTEDRILGILNAILGLQRTAIMDTSPTSARENPLDAQLTPRRRELLEWFKRNAQSLAEAYEAAIRLLQTPTFPARHHLIGHLIRDIANRLPDVLEGTTSNRVDYHSHLDGIASNWLSRFPRRADYGEKPPDNEAEPVFIPQPAPEK
jgi:hypothetical protein